MMTLGRQEMPRLIYHVQGWHGESHVDHISSRLTQADLVWRLNQCFDSAALNIHNGYPSQMALYSIHADYVFSLSGNLGTIIPASGSQSHTWRIPFDDGVYYVNYGPIWLLSILWISRTVSIEHPAVYCNIVKSKTIPLLACECPDGTACTRTYFYKESHVGTMFWIAGSHRVEGRERWTTIVYWEHLPADRLYRDR